MLRKILITYRSLLSRPAFFLAVVATLTLGIGANSAIFSVIDTVLLRPLPYPGSDRLMALFGSNRRDKLKLAPSRLEDWNRMNHSFTGLAGAYTESRADTSGELPERLMCAGVSPRFFSVLGTPPLAGRGFNSDEEIVGGPQAVVISERLWGRRFQRDTAVIGKALRFNGRAYPIVGVVPATFGVPAADVDVWFPSQFDAPVWRARDARFYDAVGRLREGVSIATAQADLAAIQGQLALQFPQTDAGWMPVVEPLKDQSILGVRRGLWILFGAVSLVLLIACANVMCLMLAQGHRRAREIAVRYSLGAEPKQVIGELLLEAFCLALPGAAGGLALSAAGATLFRTAASHLPRAAEISTDWRILGYTLALGVLTTMLFGLLPAWRASRQDPASALARGSRSDAGSGHGALRTLAGAQVALTIVLLIGAGLLIRTLSRLGQVSLGFQPENVLSLRINASWGETRDRERLQQRLIRTIDALRGIPGVEGVAIRIGHVGEQQDYSSEIKIAGRDSSGEKLFSDLQTVSPDYFRTMGIPMLAGETCRLRPSDHLGAHALVNRAFVERFFPGANPLGQRVSMPPYRPETEIGGVVGDVRESGFAADPRPTIYWCGIPPFYPDPEYLLRAQGDPMLLAGAVRALVRQIEPNRAVYDVRRLTESLATGLDERRFQTTLLSLFGATALALAVVGLYGVTSFSVAQRTREIGLRMALGAAPGEVLAKIFREGLAIFGLGALAGAAVAAAVVRSLTGLLFGIAPLDPVTFAIVPIVMGAVACVALWGPARRAMRVDPVEALRQE